MYSVGYRWHPYWDPVMVFTMHVFGVFGWTWMFYHYFYDGDHHVPGNSAIVHPVVQGQLNRLFMNEELGLPTKTPMGGIVGAVAVNINFKCL